MACNFIKKEALAQVFSCEFCEIFKNTFFTEDVWTIASKYKQKLPYMYKFKGIKLRDFFLFCLWK